MVSCDVFSSKVVQISELLVEYISTTIRKYDINCCSQGSELKFKHWPGTEQAIIQCLNKWRPISFSYHYSDVLMTTIASQFTSLTIVYSTVDSGADQSKHQSFASLAFVWGIHRGPVNSPHKWPVTRKMFPFDDVIMHMRHSLLCLCIWSL